VKKKHKYRQKANREEAKEQGFYDGRFRPRIVKDLKKHRSKRGSRDWRRNSEE
jgi:IS5 family transposase